MTYREWEKEGKRKGEKVRKRPAKRKNIKREEWIEKKTSKQEQG